MPEADSAARPSADDFLSIIRQQQLGKLKIYSGQPGRGQDLRDAESKATA